MILPVLIPCSYNRLPDNRLTESIRSTEAQNVFTDIVVFGTNGCGIFDRKNIQAEIDCRNKMVTYAKGLPDSVEFIAMQDADVIHIEPDNFKVTVDRLRAEPDLGAVACFDKNLFHIEAACVVFKKQLFTKMRFSSGNNKCICLSVKDSILLSENRFEYVDTIKRINH
jgi:hypothetical protein